MNKVEHLHDDVYSVTVKIEGIEYTEKISLIGSKSFINTARSGFALELRKAMVQAIEDTQNPKNEVQRNEPEKELSGKIGESDDDRPESETGAESETAFPGRKTKSKNR